MLARYVVWLTADKLPGFDKARMKVGATAFPKPGKIRGHDEQPVFDRFVDDQDHVDAPAVALPTKVPDAPVLRDLWTLARREWAGD